MSNPFEEILQKIDERFDKLESKIHSQPTNKRIPFKEYCQSESISRPTAYKRADLGLIKLEKVGGRNYVLADSITLTKKYQRT